MSRQQEFSSNAELCCEIAEMSGLETHRVRLLAMSRVWRELAADEKRISDLVRAVDDLLPPRPILSEPDEKRLPAGFMPRLARQLLGGHHARKAARDGLRGGTPAFVKAEETSDRQIFPPARVA
jgi:hypothetical protein